MFLARDSAAARARIQSSVGSTNPVDLTKVVHCTVVGGLSGESMFVAFDDEGGGWLAGWREKRRDGEKGTREEEELPKVSGNEL